MRRFSLNRRKAGHRDPGLERGAFGGQRRYPRLLLSENVTSRRKEAQAGQKEKDPPDREDPKGLTRTFTRQG